MSASASKKFEQLRVEKGRLEKEQAELARQLAAKESETAVLQGQVERESEALDAEKRKSKVAAKKMEASLAAVGEKLATKALREKQFLVYNSTFHGWLGMARQEARSRYLMNKVMNRIMDITLAKAFATVVVNARTLKRVRNMVLRWSKNDLHSKFTLWATTVRHHIRTKDIGKKAVRKVALRHLNKSFGAMVDHYRCGMPSQI